MHSSTGHLIGCTLEQKMEACLFDRAWTDLYQAAGRCKELLP